MSVDRRTRDRVARRKVGNRWSRRAALAAAASLAVTGLLAPEASAQIKGAQVVAGSAQVRQNGSSTVIRAADRTIIRYSQFDVPAGASVRFIQPSAKSAVLNRIDSASPSRIDGRFTANGIVYFMNPAGVRFGPTSIVNVGQLYAGAGRIADQDFHNGVNRFSIGPGQVINEGSIHADAVHLMGSSVINRGAIVAPNGIVTMTSGGDVYIGERDGNIMVKVEGAAGDAANPAAVENSGRIEGGAVRMLGAGDIYSLAIRNTGTVKARQVEVNAGGGKAQIAGNLDASASGAGEKGGQVAVLGGHVELTGAQIDASGEAGGGTVLVGGDYQGKGSLPTADTTVVDQASRLQADATGAGDGGRVIVWSDRLTSFRGEISARGGPTGGNGGFAEVSSKGLLQFGGRVDLSAPAGVGGNLLLDPLDITISTGAAANTTGFAPPGDQTEAFADDAGLVSNFDVTPGTGSFAGVAAGTTITLQATQDITVVNDFDIATATGVANVSLVLEAGRHINVNAAVTASGTGTLTLIADGNVPDGDGTVTIGATGSLTTAGGAISITGAAFAINAGGSISSGGGPITISADNMAIADTIDAGAGTVTLQPVTASQLISLGGADAAGTLGLTDGELDFVTAGILRVGRANAGNISIDAAIDSATYATLHLITGAAIVDNNAGTDITVTNLAMSAVDGIGTAADPIETAASGLAASNTTTGDIAVNNDVSGLLTVGTHDAVAGVTLGAGGGEIAISNASPLTVSSDVVNSGGGNITLTSTNDGGDDDHLTINARVIASGGNGNIAFNAGTDLLINDSGLSPDISAAGTGTITGIAERNVTIGAGVLIQSATGNIAFTGDNAAGNNGATIGIADGSVIDGGTGTITLTTDGNITLGRLVTTNATNSAVTLTSTSGGIIDGGNTGGEDVEADSGRLLVSAVTGIGSGNALETRVASVDLTASSGNIQIAETNGLTLFNVEAGGAGNDAIISSATGNITITSVTADDLASIAALTGSIIDGGNDTTADVTATTASFFAATGIGGSGANASIDVIASTVNGTNSTSGGVFLNSLGGTGPGTGAVQFGTVSASTAGNIELRAATGATLTSVTAASGTINVIGATDVFVHTATVVLGGNATITAVNDIQVGDAAGVAIDATGGAFDLTLIADSDTNGSGAITDPLGGIIAMGTGDLRLVAGNGIGASANPVLTTGLSDVAATSPTGGIFITNNTSGSVNVTTVGGTVGITTTTSGNIALVNNGGSITVSQPISTAGGGTITLSSSGAMAINNTLTTTAAGGTITLNANTAGADADSLTQGAFLISSADTSTNAVVITVNNGAGSTGSAQVGNITVGAGGSITIRTTGPAGLATTGGNITQTAANTLSAATGTVTLRAGTGAGVGTAGTPIGTTAATLVASAGTGGIFISETDGIDLAGITSGGAFTLTTVGAITDSAASVITGVTTLTAGAANNITLDFATNDFTGAVSAVTVNDLTLVDTNAIVLGASTVSNNLAVTAGGNITQTGALIVTGTSTFTVLAANSDVLLDTQANDFTGAVTITNNGNVRDLGLRNVNAAATVPALPAGLRNLTLIFNNAAIALPAVTLTGNLAVTAGGNITQSGVLDVDGTSTFTVLAANSDILLDTQANDFAGTITVTNNGNVRDLGLRNVNAAAAIPALPANLRNLTLIFNNAAIALPAVTLTGNLAVSAGGNITQTGVLDVAGTSTFTVLAANSDVLLDTQANDFTGAITVTNNGNVRDLGLRNVNAAATVPALPAGLRNLTLIFNNAAIALPAVTLTGNLVVTAGGAITDTGALVVPGTTTLTAGAFNITLDTATNNFTGAVSVVSGNNVTLVDTNAIVLGASTVSGNLAITAAGTITQTAAIAVSGTSTLAAGAGNDITLNNAGNNFVGAVSITTGNNVALTDLNAIVLGASTVSGNLTVSASGTITQTAAITVNGATSLTAGAGNDITLAQAGNNFGGAVSIVSGNNVTLVDSSALAFGASTISGNLTATSNGPITQNAAISVGGTSSFTAGAGNNITLNNAGNNFGGAVSIVSGNDVSITDSSALVLGASSISGNLVLISNGAITQTAAISVAGDTSLTAGAANDITLNQPANSLGGVVTVVSGNNVTLVDSTALVMGASTISGNLDLTSNGPITQTGAITVGGTSSLTAGAANDITLNQAANNFTGAVSVVSGNNVTLVDNSALVLGSATVSGNLSLTANGSITQSGALTIAVGGTTALAAGAVNDIVLTTAGNDFVGAVSILSGNNVSLVDVNALAIGPSTISGNLSLTAGGPITQSGAITVAGTSSLSAGPANNITLTDAANDFVGAVSIISGNNVTLADAGALLMGTSTISGNLSLTASGPITQSGAITVAGTSSLSAGAGNNITLTDAGNDFVGPVGIGSGNNVSLVDANALTLGASTISGNLALSATGTITQLAAITVPGTTTLSAGAANDITLALAGNDFIGPVTIISANNATLADANSLVLAAITTSGNVSLTTSGTITQTGPLGIGGTTTLDAGAANDIVLNNAANDFVGAVAITSGKNVTLVDVNAFAFGASTISGDLDLTAGGSITQIAPITVAGATSLATGAADDIILDQLANNFVGPVTLSGGNNVSLASTAALTMGATAVGGNLSLASQTSITATSTLTAGGNITLTSDEIDLLGGAASVSGPGTLLLQPVAADVSIDIGSPPGGTGTLDISDADIAAIAGFSSIVIGRELGEHTIVIGSASFAAPITIRTPVAGLIRTVGQLDTLAAAGAASITLDGPGSTTFLGAGLVTRGGAIAVSDAVRLEGGGSITIDATASGTAAAGATISLSGPGTVNATAGETLVINAGTAGTVNVAGSIGGTTALGAVTVLSASDAQFNGGVRVTGNISITSNGVDFSGGAGSVLSTGGGNLTIQPLAAGTSIAVGSPPGAPAVLDISDTDLAALGEGFGLITIGRPGGSGVTTVGSSSFRDSVAILQSGGSIVLVGDVLTNAGATPGSLTLDGPVTLGATAQLRSDQAGSGGTISITGPVNGAFGLTAQAGTGDVIFGATVGGTTALASLSVGGATISAPAITTSGAQSLAATTEVRLSGQYIVTGSAPLAISGPVQLVGGPVTIATQGGGDVTINGAISGNQALTVTATGQGDVALLAAAGGAGAGLISLNVSANDVTVNGATTDGDQTYTATGALSLGGDYTSSSGALVFDGTALLSSPAVLAVTQGGADANDITFTGAINGNASLTLNAAGAGDVLLQGAVGGTTPLTSVTVSADQIALTGVNTTGAQSYTGSGIALDGGHNVSGAGAIAFNGNVTLVPSAAGIAITAQGGGNADDVTFSGTINGARGLTISAAGAGDVVLSGAVGTIAAPLNLAVTADDITLQSVTTAGAQTYTASGTILVNGSHTATGSGAIRFAGSTLLEAPAVSVMAQGGSTGDDIVFTGPINGASALMLNAAGDGDVRLLGVVGGTTALLSINVSGQDLTVSGVQTTGGQTYVAGGTITLDGDYSASGSGAISFNGPVVLAAGAGAVTVGTLGGGDADDISFSGTIDGPRALSLTAAGAGDIIIAGAVGATQPLGAVTLQADAISLQSVFSSASQSYTATSPITINGTYRATGGSIAFNGNVALAAGAGAVTVNTQGGSAADAITFGGSLIGNRALNVVAAGAGDVTFGGNVGSGPAANVLLSLTVSGNRLAMRNVTTRSGQSYSGSQITLNHTYTNITSGEMRFAGPVLLAGPAATGVSVVNQGTAATANIVFTSTIAGNNQPLTIQANGAGNVSLGGSASALSSLSVRGNAVSLLSVTSSGDQTVNGSTITLNGTYHATGAGGITFDATQQVRLAGNVTVDTEGTATSAITFAGPIAQVGAGRELNIDSLSSSRRSQSVINFITSGSDAVEIDVGSLRINQALRTAPQTADVPTVATVAAFRRDANGRPTELSGPFSVRTSGDFFMGPNERMTVLGTLDLQAGGRATLSDITTLGDMNVTAAAILLQSRVAGNLLRSDGSIVNDRGSSYVAGGSIRFNRAPTVINPLNVSGPRPRFGAFVLGGTSLAQLAGFPAAVLARPLGVSDLVLSDGTVLGFQVEGVVAAIEPVRAPREVRQVQLEQGIGSGLVAELEDLGIYAREPDLAQLIAFLEGVVLYNDVPGEKIAAGAELQPEDFRVTRNRLAYDAVVRVLEAYYNLFFVQELDEQGRPIRDERGQPKLKDNQPQIKRALESALENYQRSTGAATVDPVAFRKYVENTPQEAEALRYLNGLRDLFNQILPVTDPQSTRGLGITAREAQISRTVILRALNVTGMTAEQLEVAVLGGSPPSR